jgi:hypothetical protein
VNRTLAKAFLGLSVALFAVSLTQDAYYISGDDPRAWAPAWSLLLMGWMGVFYGVFAWLGNPLLIAGWLGFAFKSHRAGVALSGLALAFMLSFLAHTTIVRSEAPTYARITGYGPAYWLWIASAGAAVVAHIVARASKEAPGPANDTAA